MEDLIRRLETKLDRLDERLDRVDVTLAKQHVTLEDHIRRTELAEAAIDRVDSDLTPIKTHVAFVGIAVKALGALATLVALATGVMKLVGMF